MRFSMTLRDQIIGFRSDRIGARLICMLNVMRLSRKFGVTGKYLWLSDPDGAHPELRDPRDFLAADFVDRHIRIIDQMPTGGQRLSVTATAPANSMAGFAATLAAGQLCECDCRAEVIRFMDEPAADAAAEIRDIARQIVLAPPLAEARGRARAALLRVAGDNPVAIHVRRGDIVDGDPRSLSAWPLKYVPDEVYRGFIDHVGGAVIAFSDRPAAIAHLAQGDPRIIPASALFDHRHLPPAARDLLEMLLIADCARVGAPGDSAFSQAASIMGRCQIAVLPEMLPPATRTAALDALLERAITHPDSFFAPGDLAQSLVHAAQHAVSRARADELLECFAERPALLDDFPFLYRELATVAWTSARRPLARRLARQGLSASLICDRDQVQCRQVLMAASARGPGGVKRDTQGQFLTMVLTGRAADGPVMPELAHRIAHAPANALTGTLLLAPELLPLFAEAPPAGMQIGPLLPLWLLRLDWSECLGAPDLLNDLLQFPDMWPKMRPAAQGLDEVETALGQGAPLPLPDAATQARFGHCASVLRLHGRLKRAFALLHWLDAASPDRALTHKRLADTCFAASKPAGGWKWLGSALLLAPENPMLWLSAAIRAADEGDVTRAGHHLDEAAKLWPDLGLIEILRHRFSSRQG